MTKLSKLKLLLAGASCAVIAACSADTAIVGPDEQPNVPPPTNDGGGGGGSARIQVNGVPAGGCPDAAPVATEIEGNVEVTGCRLAGDLTEDLTVAANSIFFLQGPVFVQGASSGSAGITTQNDDSGPTLVIEPGATLVGETGGDYLVVDRGAFINAQGEPGNPIVMTSLADLAATEAGDPRELLSGARGEWGGLIINGFAPINACIGDVAGGSEDCEKSGEGSSGLFGGDRANDSSGALRYVQVRYAGFEINNEDELNGIAFQGVGNGRPAFDVGPALPAGAEPFEYLQVHNNADDGIEFFGGTANARYLALTGNSDDSLDYTDGWTGAAQFVLVLHSTDAGDQAFEFDNNGDENDATPRSNPSISNFTLIGQDNTDIAMLLREGTAGTLVNGIAAGFGDNCLDVDNQASFDQADAGELVLRSVFIAEACGFSTDDDGFDEAAFFNSFPSNVVGESTLDGVFAGSNERAVEAFDATELGDFFIEADYVGAFEDDATAQNNWAAGWSFGLFPEDNDCPTGTTRTSEVFPHPQTGVETPVCRIEGNITEDLTLTAGNLYELDGPVFVGVDRGADPASPLPSGIEANLTIQPGVALFGSSGGDYLVVARGSQINVNGTASSPVVMTARIDLEGGANEATRGEWGGLVINGRAPINACIGAVDGGTVDCEKSGEGSSGLFGGATADDDSGSMSFLQVRYAGFEINNEDELNGIAFQAVGSGGTYEFLQVHNNADDGIEFFGGTANASHLVLTGNSDDSLDYTDGWVGGAQFVVVKHASDAGDQAFEFDNNGDANDALPRSNPSIANFTLVGDPNTDIAMLLREGTAGTLINGVATGFGDNCLDVDNDATFDQADNGDLVLNSVVIAESCGFSGDDDSFDEQAFFTGFASNVVSDATLVENGVLPAAALASIAAQDATALGPFFVEADYIGAFPQDATVADNWAQGWTFAGFPLFED
ncbi:MAG: hypothetical protein RKE49_07940 [Oceanicaulis sp.]